MKICIVSSWFPSSINPFSGSFVLAFARRMKKAGLEVEVITARDKGNRMFDFELEEMNLIPIYRVNRILPFFQMFKLIAGLKVDIIHVHAPNFFSSYAVVIGKILRIPVLATVHRVEVMPTKNPFVYFARRIVLNLFDQIVAVSEAVKRLTENCGAYKTRIRVVWNSAEEDNFRPLSKEKSRETLNLPLEKKVILFVGRLAPLKGIGYLIRAMPSILHEGKATLVIVGNGPERNNLENLVKVMNLQPHVMFLGHISTEKLALCYNAADVFVLPSLSEGHPVVLLEAMASALPIVATDVGGNRESIINEVNGFLVRSKDHYALVQAITKILSNGNMKQRFSAKSLELYHEKFSERIQAKKYLFIYQVLSKEKAVVKRVHLPNKM